MYTTIKYGVLAVTSGVPEMEAQNDLRQRYWNRLVEVEQSFWERHDQIVDSMAPDLEPLQKTYENAKERLAQLRQDGRDTRKITRSRTIPEALTSAIKAAQETAKLALADYKVERAKVYQDPDALDRLKELDTWRTAQVREARHNCELYWGNYMDLEAFYQVARRKKGRQLKFHRHTRDRGAAAVFMTEGLDTDRAFGDGPDDSRFKLDPVDPRAWGATPRSIRKRYWRTTLHIRVGSVQRHPVYATAQIVAHRPLPRGLVRHAVLTWETLAGRRRYNLMITVDAPELPTVQEGLENRPRVGIDLGWRKIEDRVRVAVLAWDNGQTEEISLPAAIISAYRKMDDLKSIADTHFNTFKLRLGTVLDQMAAEKPLPIWLAEAHETLARWRSRRRLLALAEEWGEHRLDGDETIFAELEVWRKREKVLWQWEINGRDKLTKRRLDLYRNIAYRVATTAGAVAIEEFNISQVITNPDTETAANYYRSMAACSEFRRVMESTCARLSVPVTRFDGAWTTQTCSECKNPVLFNSKLELLADCPTCNQRWDQDENAARNLLRFLEDPTPITPIPVA
ncbi:MAG TPA: zinc ribbon domain-containing protein [Dehalococcoidia bacterium]|nr:zinc ribbon domain-containing protein [Dehalococcoidia bacterium]